MTFFLLFPASAAGAGSGFASVIGLTGSALGVGAGAAVFFFEA